jgi:hypothetical protein
MTRKETPELSGQDDLEKHLALGSAYLDYCVKQGWLVKAGDGPNAQYSLTETGKKKLSNVTFNLDLSVISKRRDNTKKRRKRHKK